MFYNNVYIYIHIVRERDLYRLEFHQLQYFKRHLLSAQPRN